MLSEQGFKEVTLLGQNVNSYADTSARGRPMMQAGDGVGSEGGAHARGGDDDTRQQAEVGSEEAGAATATVFAHSSHGTERPLTFRDARLASRALLLPSLTEPHPSLRVGFKV